VILGKPEVSAHFRFSSFYNEFPNTVSLQGSDRFSEGAFESVVALGDGFVAAGTPANTGGQTINIASFDADGNIRCAMLFSISSYQYSRYGS